jgi:hypothetical protein
MISKTDIAPRGARISGWRTIAALALAAIPMMLPGSVLAQTAGAATPNKELSVVVEIEGSLPGFRPDQLSAYVTEQMDAADITDWHFEAAPTDKPSTTEPANRVVWHFKMLPYGGGAVRYIGPAISKAKSMFGVGRPVGIDAKIYLDGKYQATTFDQITIKGGSDDVGLSNLIQKLTRSIVTNAMATEPEGTPKIA